MTSERDLIERLRAAAAEAQADHDDDVQRIEEADGPLAASLANDEPIEVVLSMTTVRRCIEALSAAPALGVGGHSSRAPVAESVREPAERRREIGRRVSVGGRAGTIDAVPYASPMVGVKFDDGESKFAFADQALSLPSGGD